MDERPKTHRKNYVFKSTRVGVDKALGYDCFYSLMYYLLLNESSMCMETQSETHMEKEGMLLQKRRDMRERKTRRIEIVKVTYGSCLF